MPILKYSALFIHLISSKNGRKKKGDLTCLFQTGGIMQNTTKNTSNKKNNKYHYKLPGLGCSKPANPGIPTAQEVLSFAASKYLQTHVPDYKDDLGGFLRYLQKKQVIITGASTGSVIITLICPSLEILEVLWEDCNTGHVDKVAQKFFITNDVIREFGDVKITVTISEDEYKAGRAYFLQLSGKH